MRKSIFFILLVLIVCVQITSAKGFKGFSVGASAGYSNYQTMNAEAFFQVNLHIFEPKAGLAYHAYTVSLGGVEQLKAGSIGLFMEGTVYPFRKYFYVGVRWELFNVNWFTNDAVTKLNNISTKVPSSFLGTNFYGIAGIDLPLTKSISFRAYGMPGIQVYSISNWQWSSGKIDVDMNSGSSRTQFVFQMNVGIAVKIYRK